jgi:hypothetical protein
MTYALSEKCSTVSGIVPHRLWNRCPLGPECASPHARSEAVASLGPKERVLPAELILEPGALGGNAGRHPDTVTVSAERSTGH